jgi:hypothetical protein
MKKLFTACCAVLLLIIVVAPRAQAATNVNVRIEGKEETIFEKTIPVSVGKIEASSDTQERGCDGVNELDPENVVPGVTPTLASAEAMESIGETFDGQWYDGFGDYFITRWGPDEQDNSLSAWWGVLVNQVFTSVGGCQKQLRENDEVLWVWDAFSSRPMLALYPEAAHYVEGPRPTRVTVAPGEPVAVEVVSWGAGGEGSTPEVPSRTGSSPYAGAEVAPVVVNAKGFQRVDTASPEATVSDADGKATFTFTTPGIHRIKATGPLGAESSVVRSNGVEVCVLAQFGDCGETVGTPPGDGGEGGSGSGDGTAGGSTTPADTATKSATPIPVAAPTAEPATARVSKPKLALTDLAQGKVTLSWQVLDPGAGVKSWRIATKTLGGKGGWVDRARGAKGTQATVRLPRGHRYQVRFTLTDKTGHTTTYALGKVTVPRAGRS